MPQPKVRVVGSGFTTLKYNSLDIAYLDKFVDTAPVPFGGQRGGPGWEAITTLGDRHPSEIVMGDVLGPGTITATIRELWNGHVWEQLSGLGGTNDILDIWDKLRAAGSVTCHMVIRVPGSVGTDRQKFFHGCVITGIDNGETVEVGSLSVSRDIMITYTHATRDRGGNSGGGGGGSNQ